MEKHNCKKCDKYVECKNICLKDNNILRKRIIHEEILNLYQQTKFLVKCCDNDNYRIWQSQEIVKYMRMLKQKFDKELYTLDEFKSILDDEHRKLDKEMLEQTVNKDYYEMLICYFHISTIKKIWDDIQTAINESRDNK